MRILLSHAFNGLTQRLFALLRAANEVSLELDIADAVTEEAVALFDPDLVLAPHLQAPHSPRVWSRRVCLVVHPARRGTAGRRRWTGRCCGVRETWGVTVLQANGDFDAGRGVGVAVVRRADRSDKSALYRRGDRCGRAGGDAAVAGSSPGRRAAPALCPRWPAARGRERPLGKREQASSTGRRDDTATVLAQGAHAADAFQAPGLNGVPCRLFDLHEARGTAHARRRRRAPWPGAVGAAATGSVWDRPRASAVLAIDRGG